jgi:hypothetical protein
MQAPYQIFYAMEKMQVSIQKLRIMSETWLNNNILIGMTQGGRWFPCSAFVLSQLILLDMDCTLLNEDDVDLENASHLVDFLSLATPLRV